MVATRNGHGAVVAALLKVKGIDINVKNAVSVVTVNTLTFGNLIATYKLQRHWNALMIAAANGDNDTVLEFRPHQALIDLNATDEVCYRSFCSRAI